MKNAVLRFAASHWNVPIAQIRVALTPVEGGLESHVARAVVTGTAEASLAPWRFVVKQLRGPQRREILVYQELWHAAAERPGPGVLGAATLDGTDYLYLEDVEASSDWPWAQIDHAADTCRILARLHEVPRPPSAAFHAWDYEAELAQSAEATLVAARQMRDGAGRTWWRRPGDLRRVVVALPEIRSRLRSNGACVIHGDMHPGNVIVRSGGKRPVILDWARARMGSRWEDVAAWLHSLGCWEPAARKRHDTLLRAYVEAAFGLSVLPPALRQEYGLASACNGLAGAIRHHLAVLGNPAASTEAREHSQRALPAWERVIRHAAGLLR